MKNKKGFTLLELLVVVLIIGILAAIALPQYKKAVEKSKATQALTLLQTIYQSAMAYELATGNWPTSVDDLDVNVPSDFLQNGEWSINLNNTPLIKGVLLTRTVGKYSGTGFSKYKEHTYVGIIPTGKNLCFENKRNITPVFNGSQGSYCDKIFNGKAAYVDENNWSDVWELP